MVRLITLVSVVITSLVACAVNPVTGGHDFLLYDSQWEKQVGIQNYAPMKQAQGGEFVLDPALTAYVQEVGDRLAAKARRKEEFEFEFSIINDSIPNAWALPGGKIAINRGLLTALESEAELAAVLSHEIVHADAAHGARAQSKGAITQTSAMLSMIVLGTAIRSEKAREVAMMVPAMGAQLMSQKYGRDAERESDEYGMLYMSEAGYDPQGAVRLQETFVQLSEGQNPDWVSGLFASHPPSQERVKNNQKSARKLPKGGDWGRERYQQMTSYLKRVQPAFEAYDAAKKAVADDDRVKAQQLLNRAIAIEPRESLFHDLQGDLHMMNEDPQAALSSYRQAVDANQEFFYGHLRQGQVLYSLERRSEAEASLESSVNLMPTAEAHFLLGMIDRDSGNREQAIEHFQLAARSDSETGKKALVEFVVLDVEQNPSRYVASRAILDAEGKVSAQIGNRTPVTMRDIVVSYYWLDDSGSTRQGQKTYPDSLEAEKTGQLSLGITMDPSTDLSRRVRVEVSSASAVN